MYNLRTVGPVVLLKMFEYLFSSVDGRWTAHDTRWMHRYGNTCSSLRLFGPGVLKMKEAFVVQKLLTFFLTKILAYF